MTASSCATSPTSTVRLSGVTCTAATGTREAVISDVPLRPSLVAVMIATPTATAVTRPAGEADATAGASLVHVTSRLVTMSPSASRKIARSWRTAPIARPAAGGTISTDATRPALGGPGVDSWSRHPVAATESHSATPVRRTDPRLNPIGHELPRTDTDVMSRTRSVGGPIGRPSHGPGPWSTTGATRVPQRRATAIVAAVQHGVLTGACGLLQPGP